MKALAAAALALLSAAAQADRPLVSETADVIPAGACQVEAWAARARQSGSPAERGQFALVSCGVAGVHQFGLGATRVKAGHEHGSGFALTGKTTLRMPEAGSTGFGLGYSLGFEKAGGRRLRGESAMLMGVATQEVGDGYLLHANLGWVHSRAAGQSSTTWSLGVERGDDFTWAADVFGDDRSRPWVSAGAGWALLEKLSFNAAYALQFDRKRVKQLSVGMKLEF